MPASAPALVAIWAETADASAMMIHTQETLDHFGVRWQSQILANRQSLESLIRRAMDSGVEIFIVADDSLPPLSAAISPLTTRPVLAVPLPSATLSPLQALEAATQPGPPVATLAIGKAGAINAALLAIAILSNTRPDLRVKLRAFREEQTARVLGDSLE